MKSVTFNPSARRGTDVNKKELFDSNAITVGTCVIGVDKYIIYRCIKIDTANERRLRYLRSAGVPEDDPSYKMSIQPQAGPSPEDELHFVPWGEYTSDSVVKIKRCELQKKLNKRRANLISDTLAYRPWDLGINEIRNCNTGEDRIVPPQVAKVIDKKKSKKISTCIGNAKTLVVFDKILKKEREFTPASSIWAEFTAPEYDNMRRSYGSIRAFCMNSPECKRRFKFISMGYKYD